MDLAGMRDEKGLTQQNLADQVEVTRQMISAIENGIKPSVTTAKKIAKVMGFEWSLFYSDEEQKTE